MTGTPDGAKSTVTKTCLEPVIANEIPGMKFSHSPLRPSFPRGVCTIPRPPLVAESEQIWGITAVKAVPFFAILDQIKYTLTLVVSRK